TRQDIINEVHKHIAFMREQWERFCRMVEDHAEHIDKCINDPRLKITRDGGKEAKFAEQDRKLRDEMNSACTECNQASERLEELMYEGEKLRNKSASQSEIDENEMAQAEARKTMENADENAERVLQETSRSMKVLTEQRELIPPERGCTIYHYNYYLNIPLGNAYYWIRPGPVNPLLWFDVIVNLGTNSAKQRSPNEDERLIVECAILSVAHDLADPEISLGWTEERIYSRGTYNGKYFQRDDFCKELRHKVLGNEGGDARIRRAFDYVEPYWLVKEKTPKRAKLKDALATVLEQDRTLRKAVQEQRRVTPKQYDDLLKCVNEKLKAWGRPHVKKPALKNAVCSYRKGYREERTRAKKQKR
ncbi:MAG: hypothetical protein ABH852_01930, partial [Methanobacteriota archaeon]